MKDKKTTYGAIPKNNELLKLTSDLTHAIQKIEEEKSRINKTINDYVKLIQSIKKVYQRLVLENELFKKKKMKKLENKQFTTDLINHNKKRIAYFEGGRKRKHKNNTTLKAVAKTASLSITYQKKEKKTKENK